MKIFPSEVFFVDFSEEIALYKIMQEHVDTPTFSISGARYKPFLGSVDSTKFRIWHIVNRKNVFNPIIMGTKGFDGRLHIKILINRYVILFMLFLELFWCFGFIAIISSPYLEGIKKIGFILIMFVSFLFLLFLPWIGFNIDRYKRNDDLFKIFHDHKIESKKV